MKTSQLQQLRKIPTILFYLVLKIPFCLLSLLKTLYVYPLKLSNIPVNCFLKLTVGQYEILGLIIQVSDSEL